MNRERGIAGSRIILRCKKENLLHLLGDNNSCTFSQRRRTEIQSHTSTKDFVTFTPTTILYDHGFSVIDAFIVKSGKKYGMFLKDEADKPNTPEKNIRIATGRKPRGPYSPPGNPITGNYWTEGPRSFTSIKNGLFILISTRRKNTA